MTELSDENKIIEIALKLQQHQRDESNCNTSFPSVDCSEVSGLMLPENQTTYHDLSTLQKSCTYSALSSCVTLIGKNPENVFSHSISTHFMAAGTLHRRLLVVVFQLPMYRYILLLCSWSRS